MAILLLSTLVPVLVQADEAIPPVPGILARGGAYVDRFARNFSLIISRETYQQAVGVSSPDAPLFVPSGRREIVSEMWFVHVPEQQRWLNARDVQLVDGRTVAGGPDLATAVSGPLDVRLAAIHAAREGSARHNLGRIRRNFNDATFVLQFLAPALRQRFTFALEGSEIVQGRHAWKLSFREHVRPTVITRGGVDLVSRGAIWVSASDHAVLQTLLEVEDPPLMTRARIEVLFRYEPRFDVWVPARMREDYRQIRPSLGMMPFVQERIVGTATYSDYRRFETGARLVLPEEPAR